MCLLIFQRRKKLFFVMMELLLIKDLFELLSKISKIIIYIFDFICYNKNGRCILPYTPSFYITLNSF